MRVALCLTAMLLVSIPALCAFVFSSLSNKTLDSAVVKLYDDADAAAAVHATLDIYRMCDILAVRDQNYSDSVENALLKEFEKLGAATLTRQTFAREIRSADDEAPAQTIPVRLLQFGKTVADCADAENRGSPVNKIFQNLKKKFSCDFTLLVKTSDGDFLRLASTYSDTAGKNISGTYIPSKVENLQKSAVVETLSAGAKYSGFVSAGTSTIAVNYIPIFDSDAQVIGAFFFGFEHKSVKDMERYIASLNAPQKLNAWVIDESNPENPVVKITQEQSDLNSSIKDATSKVRKNAAFEIIEKSRVLKPWRVGTETFAPPSADGKKYMLTYAYYRPWKWVIGTLGELGDYSANAAAVSDKFPDTLADYLPQILAFSLCACLIAALAAAQPLRRIWLLADAARAAAEGSPSLARKMVENFEARGHSMADETGAALLSLKAAAAHLETLSQDIAGDAAALAKGAAKIAAFARNAENINDDELVQMKSITRTGRAILASSESLKKSAAVSAGEIQKALNLNRECENAIDALMRKYDNLSAASNSVSQKLSAINENAEKITTLVGEISEVGLKTNMLSLNASIEAEKAGEDGLGFAVVSRRIRAMADSAAKASNDIGEIVQQMRSSVNSGVMEMDKFSASMRDNSRTTVATAKKLSSTISNMESVGPRFENIAERISELGKIAVSITDAIQDLADETSRVRENLAELADADKSAEILGREVKLANGINGGRK